MRKFKICLRGSGTARIAMAFILFVSTLIETVGPALLMSALVLCWPMIDSSAMDPRQADFVSIGAVLNDPQHCNLHRVRFEGKVTQILALPNQGGCGTVDAYLLQIEDETGALKHLTRGDVRRTVR